MKPLSGADRRDVREPEITAYQGAVRERPAAPPAGRGRRLEQNFRNRDGYRDDDGVSWTPCSDCAGARIVGDHCLAHLTGSEQEALGERLASGHPLDARGVNVSVESLAQLLDRVRGADGRPKLPAETRFDEAVFAAPARLEDVHFLGDVHFDGVRFVGDAHFDYVTFHGAVDLRKAQFGREADFRSATFSGKARFAEAQFQGEARFQRASFLTDASLRRCTFSQRAQLGPMFVGGSLLLNESSFEQDVRIEMSARGCVCRSTRFRGRTDLHLRWAEVALDGASFSERARLAGVKTFARLTEDELLAAEKRFEFDGDARGRPRLLSLRQASVEGLALSNVDLRACRFFGARGLDQLRLEPGCEFAAPPARRRYTRRLTLAEEHQWRAGRQAGHGRADAYYISSRSWYAEACRPPAGRGDLEDPVEPSEIATVYRALRKALEDRKDEPGAGDFYYGEMEMRRQQRPGQGRATARFTRDRGERALITVYWLVSGYGLRASRAFASLAVTLAVGAGLLAWFGFRSGALYDPPYDRSYAWALLFALESANSLLRPPQLKLTVGGEIMQIALRILGPLFVGLALLALRGRVKR